MVHAVEPAANSTVVRPAVKWDAQQSALRRSPERCEHASPPPCCGEPARKPLKPAAKRNRAVLAPRAFHESPPERCPHDTKPQPTFSKSSCGGGWGEREKGEGEGGRVCLASIQAAARRIEPYVHRTPVMTCEGIDKLAGHGRQLIFKCELFQKTGSFKARGACNATLLLPPSCRAVVTHSSGNHAQALAWAAQVRGVRAHCVMPNDASPAKAARVRDYGADVVLCTPSYGARVSTAAALVREHDAVLVHSSNDPRVIDGQGTVGLELVEQVREMCGGADLDAVIVPVGGGGLLAGVAVAVRALCPRALVIGAEPSAADDAARSKAAGMLLEHDTLPDTLADGLRTVLGSWTWPVVRDQVDCIVTVSEDEIRASLRLVYERLKLAIEPSAAVGVAAALSGAVAAMPGLRRIGVVLCGGNVDMAQLAQLLA